MIFASEHDIQPERVVLNADDGSNWGLASVLPHRWAAVFVNTSVAVGRD